MRLHRPTSATNRHVSDSLIGVQRPDLAAALFPQADAVLAKLPGQAAVYCVGGAVRDMLLGTPSTDRDYVVVGVRVDDMLNAGFVPVGKDFPVFLHPHSHDEYALARTERKSGKGYKGFVFLADPSVTLNEDLARRDLTINAIAIDSLGTLIDPYQGLNDLAAKTFRHVSNAFSEDPVRLLRLARFAARWPEFQLAPETQTLCEQIVANGEANALVAERVWQELQTGLMEREPSRMIETLQRCGAWQAITHGGPQINSKTLALLEQAGRQALPLEARYGLLIHNRGSGPLRPDQFKAPKHCQEFASLLIHATQNLPQDVACAQATLDWIFSTDFQRKPERFALLLDCMSIEGSLNSHQKEALSAVASRFSTPDVIEKIAQAAKEAEKNGAPIKQAVQAARLAILKTQPQFSQGR
jgi:tRNA nucleotidyltransferase (CCA-adding enzyme)